MKIQILHHFSKASQAKGLTVVIDVLRAFSTACVIFGNGAKRIIAVGDLDEAYALKKSNPKWILMGERKGKPPAGFDFGNSPYLIRNISFKGKIVILTTSSGTQGIVGAKNADEIITGSLLNADAVCAYIKRLNPKTVTLLCTNSRVDNNKNEDEYCAEYIKAKLEGKSYNLKSALAKLPKTWARRFFDLKNQSWSPKGDFEFCMQTGKFDFVIRAKKDLTTGLIYLEKEKIYK